MTGNGTGTGGQALNPFSNAGSGGVPVAAEADTQRAIAEVQAAVVMAKRFPRDQRASMGRILQACTRATLADQAIYQYKRGDGLVTGPSIRLAEAIAQQWGNLTFGMRELDQESGVTVCEAFAWDLESNTRSTKVFHVPHKRVTKRGTQLLTDPRDIYELAANMGARRMRNCILAVIPGDVVEAAVQQCDVTQANNTDASPEAVQALLEAFNGFGVTQQQIEDYIQHPVGAIKVPGMLRLRRVFASIKDGFAAPGEFFAGAPGRESSAPTESASTSRINAKVAESVAAGAGQGKIQPGKVQPAQTQASAQGEAEPQTQASAQEQGAAQQEGANAAAGAEGDATAPPTDEVISMMATAVRAGDRDQFMAAADLINGLNGRAKGKAREAELVYREQLERMLSSAQDGASGNEQTST